MSKKSQKKNTKKNKQSESGIRNFIRTAFLLGPITFYTVVCTFVFPAPNSGFLVLSFIGCFLLGIGAANSVGLLKDKEWRDVKVRVLISVLIGVPGALLVLISSIIMYVPAVYSCINEQSVTNYFVIGLFLLMASVYYFFFRTAVSLHLKSKGYSKTSIRKLTTGNRNFWWYERAHSECGLGGIYYINKSFTILYAVTGTIQLLLGWLKAWQPVAAICTCALLLHNVYMFAICISTWEYAGSDEPRKKPAVFLIGGLILPFVGCYSLISLLFA